MQGHSRTLSNDSKLMQQLCLICCSSPPDAILQNCGHGGYCYECARQQLSETRKCPTCRQVRAGAHLAPRRSASCSTPRPLLPPAPGFTFLFAARSAGQRLRPDA